jgi:hypothetical protein
MPTLAQQQKPGDLVSAITATIPNPAIDGMEVDYMIRTGVQTSSLILRDLSGRIVGRYDLDSHGAKQQIDLGKLDSGIYFLSLVTDGKMEETKKIVVAH